MKRHKDNNREWVRRTVDRHSLKGGGGGLTTRRRMPSCPTEQQRRSRSAGDKITSGTKFSGVGTKASVAAGLLLLAAMAYSQQTPTPVTASPLPTASYLVPAFPGSVLGLLFTYGNRLNTPGNERLTLTGSFTDVAGTSSATVITQIPGQVKVTIAGAASKTLIFNGTQATSNGAAATGTDLDLLESFQADTVENFFYSYGTTAAVRFLGARYRTDGKTTAGYTGPWYDIFELMQAVAVSGGGAARQKFYYFDSTTGRFAKARYAIQRGGQRVEVQTVYSGWTKTNGQSLPGQVERLENGVSVFTFTVTGGQLSVGTQDATFITP